MTTSDWILILNGIAILLAPVVALWVGGILQTRSDAYKAKLTVFGTLIALGHTPLSTEMTRALNLIDAVFSDVPGVREAWTRYITTLNDQNMNTDLGGSIREEKRRDLLLEIVKSLKLSRKISSADLLRTYLPTFVAEETHIAMLDRIHKRAVLQEDLARRGIQFPRWPEGTSPAPNSAPLPAVTGDGAAQPRSSD